MNDYCFIISRNVRGTWYYFEKCGDSPQGMYSDHVGIWNSNIKKAATFTEYDDAAEEIDDCELTGDIEQVSKKYINFEDGGEDDYKPF